MQVNNIHSNIDFKALIVRDKQVMEVIKSRTKTLNEFNKFSNLVASQKNNPFNIHIDSIISLPDKKQYLRAYIYDGHSFYQECRESFVSTFFSPIKFIVKVCNDANILFRNRQNVLAKK